MNETSLIEQTLDGRPWDDEHASRGSCQAYLEDVLRLYAETSGNGHGNGNGGDHDEAETAFQPREQLASAALLGREWHRQRLGIAALVRELAELGRRLERVLDMREGGHRNRARLHAILDEATAQVIESYSLARRGRRDRWLSYFAHEMRNSLNTLVNALWILRNSERTQTQKICDMADRAIRRLETSVQELRELESNSAQPAPGRPDDDATRPM